MIIFQLQRDLLKDNTIFIKPIRYFQEIIFRFLLLIESTTKFMDPCIATTPLASSLSPILYLIIHFTSLLLKKLDFGTLVLMLSDKIFTWLKKHFGKLKEKLKQFPSLLLLINSVYKQETATLLTWKPVFGKQRDMLEEYQMYHIT